MLEFPRSQCTTKRLVFVGTHYKHAKPRVRDLYPRNGHVISCAYDPVTIAHLHPKLKGEVICFPRSVIPPSATASEHSKCDGRVSIAPLVADTIRFPK